MRNISYIYIISNGSDYKIGVSVNPINRLKQLRTGCPDKLELMATYPLPKSKVYQLEKLCHNAIRSHYRKRGEWFKDASLFHLDIIIDEICADLLIGQSSS